MYVVHNHIDDPSAPYYAVLIAKNWRDVGVARSIIWKETQPEHGVGVDCFDLRDTLWVIGARRDGRRFQRDTEKTTYLKDLLLYSTDAMRDYLVSMMIRIAIDRHIGSELRRVDELAMEKL